MTTTKEPQKLIWVGFEAKLGELKQTDVDRLHALPGCGPLIKLAEQHDPFFATMYKWPKREMEQWYKDNHGKHTTGNLTKIVCNDYKGDASKCKFAVAYINYRKPELIILANRTAMTPIQLKLHVMSRANQTSNMLHIPIEPRIRVPLYAIRRP